MIIFKNLSYKIKIDEIRYSGSDSALGNQFDNLRGFSEARHFEDELAEKFMIMERLGSLSSADIFDHESCPICGGVKKPKFLFDKSGYKHWRCSLCEAIFVAPSLSQSFILNNVYNDQAYPFLDAVNSDVQRPLDTLRFQDLLPVLLDRRKSIRRILDLGCGGGLFLSVCKAAGLSAFGVDCLSAAVNYGKKNFNVDIHYDDVFNFLTSTSEKYDAITAFELLDHIVEPNNLIKLIKQRLSPGGVLILTVRNSRSLAAEVMQKQCPMFLGYAHLNFWSPDSIIKMAIKYNFDLEFMYSFVSYKSRVIEYLRGNSASETSIQEIGSSSEIIGNLKGYKLTAVLHSRD